MQIKGELMTIQIIKICLIVKYKHAYIYICTYGKIKFSLVPWFPRPCGDVSYPTDWPSKKNTQSEKLAATLLNSSGGFGPEKNRLYITQSRYISVLLQSGAPEDLHTHMHIHLTSLDITKNTGGKIDANNKPDDSYLCHFLWQMLMSLYEDGSTSLCIDHTGGINMHYGLA
jgi:hypothetical protein